jgi:dTDP-4-dehydrorhamnose reductase
MKILLLGKDGQVGWELQRALAPLGEVIAPGLDSLDLVNPDKVRALLRETKPQVIVNAAAYTAVDKAESDAEQARVINADAPALLAEEARRVDAWLVHYSTDYVYNGAKAGAYVEDDAIDPLSVYCRTKAEGDEAIRKTHDRHVILRTSWVYAARGSNFAKTMLRLAQEREELKVVADQYGVPTSAEFLADTTALALYRLRLERERDRAFAGTYHVAAAGETTWYEYARFVIGLALERGARLKCTPERIIGIPAAAYPSPARRPMNSRLDTSKLRNVFGIQPPDWRYHVTRLVEEISP